MDNKVIIGLVVVVVVIAAAVGIGLAMNNNSNEDKGIEYLANGGAESITGNTSVFNKSATIPEILFEKNNYTLLGYTVSSDGSGTLYEVGDKVPDAKKLYAKYEFNTKITVIINDLPDTIQVKYKGNALTSEQVLEDSECKFSFEVIGNGVTYTFNSVGSQNVSIKESGDLKYTMGYIETSYRPSTSKIDGGDLMDETHFTIDTEQIKTLTINFRSWE